MQKIVQFKFKNNVVSFNYKENDYICKYWLRHMFYELPLLEKIKV